MAVSKEIIICFGRIYEREIYNSEEYDNLFHLFPIVDFIDIREFPKPGLYDPILDFLDDDFDSMYSDDPDTTPTQQEIAEYENWSIPTEGHNMTWPYGPTID